jgi:4-hydroxybenzoate polyprenyltransferase
LVQEFGEQGFDYIGDDISDIAVWKRSRKSLLVSRNKKVLRAARSAGLSLTVLSSPDAGIGAYLSALRSRQWVKNTLVGVAAFLMHTFTVDALLLAALAFVAFSACASVVYVLNDLIDLPADRRHPTKKNRPFAAGILPLHQAPKLFAGGLFLTVAPCLFLPSDFALILGVYFGLNLAYSFILKRRLFIDVMLLSVLYVLRIAAGSAAIGIEYSNWLLSFSMFIFTSLALIKRSTELILHEADSKDIAAGRAYLVRDRSMLEMLAAGSGMASIMVFSLYIDSQKALGLYTHPQMLWLIAPLLLYWIGRLLLLAHRGVMHDDPVYFALKDKTSIVCGLAGIGIVCAAI